MSHLSNKYILLRVTCFLYITWFARALSPGSPRVYIVTPAPKSVQVDEGRSAPFFYKNWIKRMDSPINATTTTTAVPNRDSQDLIFAEFGNKDDEKKSIRNLLEKEKVKGTVSNSHLHFDAKDTNQENENGAHYMSMYNNVYDSAPFPVYLPSTTPSPSTVKTTTPPTTVKMDVNQLDVKNIWHIIDSQKLNDYTGKWEEQDIVSDKDTSHDTPEEQLTVSGFNPSGDKKEENESRAILKESNLRFPYVGLKNFGAKKSMVNKNVKTGNNVYTSLDNFQDVKYPVRGEAQDVVHNRAPIDRYNSAQPYFPPDQQKNSKQSSLGGPLKTTGNLVPPPPPPKSVNDYLPPPATYESFPPYPPNMLPFNTRPNAIKPPQVPNFADVPPMYEPQPDDDNSNDSPSSDENDDSDSPPPGYGYASPMSQFIPTIPTVDKPPKGYMYKKPSVNEEPDSDTHPKYKYPNPHIIFPPEDHSPPDHSYDSDDHHPPHDGDFPELIFNKPHGGHSDGSNGNDNNGNDMMQSNDMGMVPPPPPPGMKPHASLPSGLDSGFPHDFPEDFKFHDDHDDFYHDHHYHHHPTTTTTSSTEMPRVNRYSYYYLGKKLYYIPLYFSLYFVAYVAALIIKAILRHKIVYPNSWRPNDASATFFSKRSVDGPSWNLTDEKLHEVTRLVTNAIYSATEKYMNKEK